MHLIPTNSITINRAVFEPGSSQLIVNKFSVSNSRIREETLEGKRYTVCPMVMGVEGVLVGNTGAGFYSAKEWAKAANAWNHTPVVVYHPEDEGKSVTACRPDKLNTMKVGLVLNAYYDSDKNKLRAEAWIDAKRAEEVDPRVMTSIRSGKVMEVSTGLEIDRVPVQNKSYKGKKYDWEATNHRPDHLALLPDVEGACSVKDGAGLLQTNSAGSQDDSQDDSVGIADMFSKMIRDEAVKLCINQGYLQVSSQLSDLVYKNISNDAYVVEVFESTFVYSLRGEYHLMSYKLVNDIAELTGSPEKVVRTVEFKTISGVLVGNTAEVTNMAKKELVDSVIAKGAPWSESDRAFLESKDDAFVISLGASAPAAAGTGTVPASAAGAGVLPPPAPVAPVIPAAPVQNQAMPNGMTLNQLLVHCDPGTQMFLNDAFMLVNNRRAELMQKITTNVNNKFTPARLNDMTTPDLEALAAMSGTVAPAAPVQNQANPLGLGGGMMNYGQQSPLHPMTNYTAQGVTPSTPAQQVTTNAGGRELPKLAVPVMDWGFKK